MNLDEMINSMTPEVYQRLSTAVELGKCVSIRAVEMPMPRNASDFWKSSKGCYGRRETILTRSI